MLYRFDAPLFFANSRNFREEIRKLAESATHPKWIVVAAEPITDIDTTAADMLEDLDVELSARGVLLIFAELKDPVRTKLERYALDQPISADHFYPTVHSAVDAFEAAHGGRWERPKT